LTSANEITLIRGEISLGREIMIDSLVYAEVTNAEGIVKTIHNGAARLQITKGRTPITDYYLSDLKLINYG
jgi:hypothetical protein